MIFSKQVISLLGNKKLIPERKIIFSKEIINFLGTLMFYGRALATS